MGAIVFRVLWITTSLAGPCVLWVDRCKSLSDISVHFKSYPSGTWPTQSMLYICGNLPKYDTIVPIMT